MDILILTWNIIVFIQNIIQVWGKTGGKIYGPVTGKDYKDNQLRFSLLCLVCKFIFKKCEVSYVVELLKRHFYMFDFIYLTSPGCSGGTENS